MERVFCPVCGGRRIGKLGQNLYYCWDCAVEFSRTKRGWQAFEVQADGSRLPLKRDELAGSVLLTLDSDGASVPLGS
ncbi:MAG TPA: hypothetical protein GX507_02370 [Clostridia bacterium]|nr:hypothetical protein [Clostridia bacterium]